MSINIDPQGVHATGDDLATVSQDASTKAAHALGASGSAAATHPGWATAGALPPCQQAWTTHLTDLVTEIASTAQKLHNSATTYDWDRPSVWVHADLHPANVVVSDGTLSGVIDFGELCAGDLAAAWLLLPAGAAPQFFDAYATADAAMIRRARGRAVLQALVLVGIGQVWEQGLPGGKQTWGPTGQATIDRVLAST
jgi:hypothetical protein